MRRHLKRALFGGLFLVSVGCTPSAAEPGGGALLQDSAWGSMTPEARQVVEAASVRFLLLPAPYAQTAIATSGPRWSALSARDETLTVSLHGTDLSHDANLTEEELARAEPTSAVRGVAARVLINEGIRSVAWNERGVDWSLEVECYDVTTDVRCTEDAFVLDLAERLEEAPQ